MAKQQSFSGDHPAHEWYQDAMAENEKLKAALRGLLNGLVPYEYDICTWCSALEGDPHEDDCAYMKAKALLGED